MAAWTIALSIYLTFMPPVYRMLQISIRLQAERRVASFTPLE